MAVEETIPVRALRKAPGSDQRLLHQLRAKILNGSLTRGERIVEGKWAAKFRVAQASIREAMNILTQEGFVTNAPGRSTRVIHLERFAKTEYANWEKREEHAG